MSIPEANFDFDKILVNYLNDKEPREHEIGVYRASEVSKCNRALYYIYKSDPKNPGIKQMRVFEVGHVIHEFVENLLKEHEWFIACEEEISKEFNDFTIMGHYDALIKEEGHLAVIDFKTTKNIPTRLYDNHLKQVNTYLHLKGVEVGYVVYIEKNSFKTKTFPIYADKILFEETLLKTKHLHKCLQEGKIPMMEKTPLCNYCDFKKKCFDLYMKENKR